jgi:hypothetical protein
MLKSFSAWMTIARMNSSQNRCQKRAPFEMRQEIVEYKLSHGLARFDCARRLVGLQQYVIQLEEAWVDLGLAGEHVEGAAANASFLQRIEQGVIIDVGGTLPPRAHRTRQGLLPARILCHGWSPSPAAAYRSAQTVQQALNPP